MAANDKKTDLLPDRPFWAICLVLIAIGFATFVTGLLGRHPERAWQAYLIGFLLLSAVAQGAVLFSAIMHFVKARWAGPLSNLAEAFTAFFPISFGLFLLLFLGKSHIFPWLHHDLHGKEVWLNLPFLFTRDFAALFILYALGFAYLYHSLWPKLDRSLADGKIRKILFERWDRSIRDAEQCHDRKTVFAVLYMLAFALVLSLIGYDLVMSADPHWYSTLFGAYTFVKAFYVGLGGLIILASILHLNPEIAFSLRPSQFHDIGKLFFAFCLVWADFFYCQFIVIWYGNIPEETAYVIERTMTPPWNTLAWVVFIVCFVAPFLILLNKNVKTKPRFMSILCSVIIMGIWLEHTLVLGPALNHHATALPIGISDCLIFLGFLGLMVMAVARFLSVFPELARTVGDGEVN